jgi:hypothetical protein
MEKDKEYFLFLLFGLFLRKEWERLFPQVACCSGGF